MSQFDFFLKYNLDMSIAYNLVLSLHIPFLSSILSTYGNTGCRVFKWEAQNWRDFCLSIKKRKINYCILRIGVMKRSPKTAKLTFKINFICQKS